MITMLLGGLWHGAGWTFVCWGAVHGLYIVMYRAWTALKSWMGFNGSSSLVGRWMGRALTFGSVVVAWVFFRSASMDTAFAMLGAMFPFDPIALSQQNWQGVMRDWFLWTTILPLLVIVFVAPNTQEWVGYKPTPDTTPPGRNWMHALSTKSVHAMAMACLLVVALSRLGKVNVFLYFNF
jgi:hypothetical protein